MAQSLQTLPDATSAQWSSVGQPVRDILQPGKTYSIGLEFRSAAPTEIKLGLGTFNPSPSSLGLVVSQSTLPVSTNDWKTYWSAPFTVTAEQLRNFSSLKFIRSRRSDDGVEFRNVRILTHL